MLYELNTRSIVISAIVLLHLTIFIAIRNSSESDIH